MPSKMLSWSGLIKCGSPQRTWRTPFSIKSTRLGFGVRESEVVAAYSSSKPWLMNFSVRVFSVTVRTTRSGVPSGISAGPGSIAGFVPSSTGGRSGNPTVN